MTPDPLSADESRPEAERLASLDDQATRSEGEFLADALARRRRALESDQAQPAGLCMNCGAVCLPQARYCDRDCRADHEVRLRVLARQGRASPGAC